MRSIRDAVVFAGGLGTRLGALGHERPKALLPVDDDRLLIDVVVAQLRRAGVRRVVFALGHRADDVIAHVGDGSRLGIGAEYHLEDLPLGTAGALARIGPMRSRFLVANCDVITDLDPLDALATHLELGAELTVCARRVESRCAYGVLDVQDASCRSSRLLAMREKPIERRLVNMGLYVLEPSVLDVVPRSRRADMDEVVQRLLSAGRVVATHAHDGSWLDVGTVQAYERASIRREAAS